MNNIVIKELEDKKIKKIYILEDYVYENEDIKNFFNGFDWIKININSNINVKNDGFLLLKEEKEEFDKFSKKNKLLKIFFRKGILHLNRDQVRMFQHSIILNKNNEFSLDNKSPYLTELINSYNIKNEDLKRGKEIIKLITEKKNSYFYTSYKKNDKNFRKKNTKNILIQDDIKVDNIYDLVKNIVEKNSDANIYFNYSPERFFFNKKIDSKINDIVNVIDFKINSLELLEEFDIVYVNKSYIGFEALLLNKEVYCLEENFYSDLCLTKDLYKKNNKRKEKKISIEQLVYILYELLSINKIDNSNKLCSSKELLLFFNDIQNKEKLICLFGFPENLKFGLKGYFSNIHKIFIFDNGSVDIIDNNLHKLGKTIEIVIWQDKQFLDLERFSKDKGVRILRVSPGPIQTIINDIDNIQYSLYFDNINLISNYNKPSELKTILNNFKKEENIKGIETSSILMNTFISKNISKIMGLKEVDIKKELNIVNEKKELILVVGQDFENDIYTKNYDIKSNLELVTKVYEQNKNAIILYKIDFINTKDTIEYKKELLEIMNYARVINEKVSFSSIFKVVNKIYTLSSIIGMEGLIRKIPVYCIGNPIYAGWGLTIDTNKDITKKRNLTIEELFYVLYIYFPRYINKRILEISSIKDVLFDIEKFNNVDIKLNLIEIKKDDIFIEENSQTINDKKNIGFFYKLFNIFSVYRENK